MFVWKQFISALALWLYSRSVNLGGKCHKAVKKTLGFVKSLGKIFTIIPFIKIRIRITVLILKAKSLSFPTEKIKSLNREKKISKKRNIQERKYPNTTPIPQS